QPVPPRQRGAEISESVERLILWALEKDREKRLSSAREMLRWLKAAGEGETVPYQPPRPGGKTPEPRPAAEKPAENDWSNAPLAGAVAKPSRAPLKPRSDPPRAAAKQLDLDDDSLSAPASADLEIDETALRPSVPPSRQSTPGMRIATSAA